MRERIAILKRFASVLLLSLLLVSKPIVAQDFTVNLKDTDIQEFIEFVADVTGTTIVIDPSVKGKVKVVSSKPVSRAELYDLFLSILDVHGYTAVRSGEIVRVIPNKNARSAPVDVISGTSVINDEYVTQVIRLENVSAAKLIPVLRPLVPQQAHMAAYAPSNAIIISDVRANISRIAEIIDRMDQSAVKETEVVKLRYGVASDVVEMLKTLEKSRAGEGADANDEASLVADKRTNSVIVTADEVSIERIKGLIEYLDIPLEQSGNVRVMYLEYADATEVAEVLTRVMQNLARLDDENSGRNRSANAAKSTIEADAGTTVSLLPPIQTKWLRWKLSLPDSISVVRKCWWKPSSSRSTLSKVGSLGYSGCSPTTRDSMAVTLVRPSWAPTLPLLKRSCLRTPRQQKLQFAISRARYHRFQAPPSDGVWLMKTSR